MRLILGDSIQELKKLPDNSVDTIITEPPYGLGPADNWRHGMTKKAKKGFMGKTWDVLPSIEIWKECLRVAKPGATLLSFGGTRTYHRLACAIEDAGWIVKDCLMWLYGCLSEDTEILTSNGLEHYHKNIDKSLILCYNVDSKDFKFEKPIKSYYYENEYPAYRIKSNFTDQIVSRNHRVLVEQKGKFIFQTAESLALQQEICIPFLESLQDLPETIQNVQFNTSIKKQDLLFKVLYKEHKNKQKNKDKKFCRKKNDKAFLLCLWERILETNLLVKKVKKIPLQSQMQWCRQGQRVGKTRTQKQSSLDTKEHGQLSQKDVRSKQSCMERWCDLFQKKWKLWKIQDKIYQMSKRIFNHGSKRRLCYGTSYNHGFISEQTFIKDGSSTPQRPQSRKQSVRKSSIIQNQPSTQKIRRTKALIKQINYNGKIWCVEVPSGAFVARRNGKIFITGNSGFPKSLNIGKAVDKLQGNEREDLGEHPNPAGSKGNTFPLAQNCRLTKGTSEWEGWGTGLKPAYEPILVCIKKCEGTYAENALKHGVAGLNIDQARIEIDFKNDPDLRKSEASNTKIPIIGSEHGKHLGTHKRHNSQGRFPSNLILSCTCDDLFQHSPDCPVHMLDDRWKDRKGIATPGHKTIWRGKGYKGGASRFFYCAKASKAERSKNCEGLEKGNTHPCIKPVRLLEYLCTLTKTPTGGIVLDPFMGSGTTGLACKNMGRNFLGIEISEEYMEIAKARLNYTDPT